LLRLVHAPPGSAGRSAPELEEWGEFGHLPGRRFASFDEIREEIARDTERVCGQQQAVSAEPIVLQISSPRVIDLTLIDLPGIARVPVGDQPLDIEKQLRGLVLNHITNPRCLILAVVAGNADLATADALAMAREVDPDGQRTIGVVTKLDLVDSSFDALGVLDGRIYPLRQGFVGVVCRSLQDVKLGKGIKDHLQVEDQFFRSHRTLRSVASRCGIGYLSKRLNRILMDHILEALPDLKAQVQSLILENEAELRGYGESVTGRPLSEQGAVLLSLFTKFAGRFGDAIEGKLAGQRGDVPGQLVGRARIDFIFRDVFARTVRDFDTFTGLSDEEIRVAIRNATGPRASLFVPEVAFELLARKQIAKLSAPSLQCADLVFDELQRVLMMSEVPEFRRYAGLREQVFGVVRGILKRSLEPTKQMIQDLVDIELAYINTSHPSFIGTAGALRAAAGAAVPSSAASTPGPVTDSKESSGGGADRTPAVSTEQDRHSRAGSADDSTPQAQAPGSAPAAVGFFSSAFGLFRATRGSPAGEGAAPSPPEPARRELLSEAPVQWQGTPGSSTGFLRRKHSPGLGGGSLKLPSMPPTISPASVPPTQRERVEVAIIKMLLDNYLGIVKKNVVDSVPKTVMHFMVNSLKDVIQSECVARLYKEESFGGLLEEAHDVQSQRHRCSARLQALNRVIEVTEQLRELLYGRAVTALAVACRPEFCV